MEYAELQEDIFDGCVWLTVRIFFRQNKDKPFLPGTWDPPCMRLNGSPFQKKKTYPRLDGQHGYATRRTLGKAGHYMVSWQHIWLRVVSYRYPLQYPQHIILGTSVHVDRDRDLATLYQHYGSTTDTLNMSSLVSTVTITNSGHACPSMKWIWWVQLVLYSFSFNTYRSTSILHPHPLALTTLPHQLWPPY